MGRVLVGCLQEEGKVLSSKALVHQLEAKSHTLGNMNS